MKNDNIDLEYEAKELYRQGFSVREVAEQLSTNKSSVGRWVKNVERYIDDDIYPMKTIDKAFMALVIQLQASSFRFAIDFHKSLSIILFELLLDLMHGIDDESYCSLEKDILAKLVHIIQNGLEVYDAHELLKADLEEAFEYYGI